MRPHGLPQALPGHARPAPQHVAALADPDCCRRWLAEIDAALDAASHGATANRERPCSLPLARLPRLFDELVRLLSPHPRLAAWFDASLGPRRVLLADHCFVRHQPAPRDRQPGQHPHSWHQDGALGFDFIRHAEAPWPADALAPMAVCWLTLVPCGPGTAPSLAWVTPSLDQLWPLAGLNEAAIEHELARSGGALHALHTACLGAGDALLLDGGTLHRTHADEDMTQARTSVELRWLPADAVPARLASGRLWPAA